MLPLNIQREKQKYFPKITYNHVNYLYISGNSQRLPKGKIYDISGMEGDMKVEQAPKCVFLPANY